MLPVSDLPASLPPLPIFLTSLSPLRSERRLTNSTVVQPFRIAAEAFIETKHTTHDGLVIKRLKRLPRARSRTSTPAELENAIPADLLSQFSWTKDPLQYLAQKNHHRVRVFLNNIIFHLKSGRYSMFPDIDYVLHPRALPASVQEILRNDCQLPYLSVVVHNYMIICHDEDRYTDRLHRFTASGWDFIDKLGKLLDLHFRLYYNRGHIPFYELHGLKPTGALADRLKELGMSRMGARDHAMGCLKMVHYLLQSRDDFNQTFPADTLAGILADIDAIRKDELPPSYVDWPGKYDLHKVGMFPDHDTANKLFDSCKFADYKPDRMWEHWHPSPTKERLKREDYNTPVRRAMQKNALVKDQQGQWQARKGALKKVETDFKAIEKRCENETTEFADERLDIDMHNPDIVKEGRATFIDSPIAFYMQPVNTPIQKSKTKRKAPMTPFPVKLDRADATEPTKAAEQAEEPPRGAHPVQMIESPSTIQTTGPVEPIAVANTLPARDVLPIDDVRSTGVALSAGHTLPAATGPIPAVIENALPAVVRDGRATQDAVSAAEDQVAAGTIALPITKDAISTIADGLPIAGDTSVTDDESVTDEEHEPVAFASAGSSECMRW